MGRVGPRGDARSEAGREAEPEGVVGVGEEAAGQAAGEREGGWNGGVCRLERADRSSARRGEVALPRGAWTCVTCVRCCDLVTTFSYLAHLGPGLIIGERNKLGLAPVQPSLSSLDSDKGTAKKTSCPSPGRARAPAHIKSRWLSPR